MGSEGSAATIRVLLADDHRLLRDGLRRSLTEDGFDVVGDAADGTEAVRLACALRPDVVLMDITMAGVDGVEATRQLRRRRPEVAVLMLTMHADADLLAAAVRAGAVGYLVKDCSADEIADAVRQAASAEAALSPPLAASMLAEVHPATGERLVSTREEEVLQLIADGCSTREVGMRLYISEKTVKNHLASTYHKLDARDRTQAVLRAVRLGIIRLDDSVT